MPRSCLFPALWFVRPIIQPSSCPAKSLRFIQAADTIIHKPSELYENSGGLLQLFVFEEKWNEVLCAPGNRPGMLVAFSFVGVLDLIVGSS